MKQLITVFSILWCCLGSPLFAATTLDSLAVEPPKVVMSGLDADLSIQFFASELPSSIEVLVNGKSYAVTPEAGKAVLSVPISAETIELNVSAGGQSTSTSIHPIPLWLSIVPPLLAILMALVFREVITALFLGIFCGAATIGIYQEGFLGIFSGLFAVIDTYLIGAMEDWSHLAVVVFSLVIGAVVAVISKNGGMHGVVNHISRYATTPRSGQMATWVLGVAIFFDDYANTLVVGNTMRPVTDRLFISREKLSYLVDSTAAPIAAIAFVTTWIGAELGYIKDSIVGLDGFAELGIKEYSIFLSSLPYSFYPVLTLGFMLFLIWRKRDFGPMWHAENRARTGGGVSKDKKPEASSGDEMDEFQPVEGIQPRAINAIVPIAVIIFGTLFGLAYTGYHADPSVWTNPEFSFSQKLSGIVGNSDSYSALLWASLSGLLVALLLSIGQGILTLQSGVETAMQGVKTMLTAIVILVLAWSLAQVTGELHTADFLTGLLSGNLSPYLVPALTFILAALTAFSTGSSWGAMAILYPLVLPACWQIGLDAGMDTETLLPIFYNAVASVLAGSVLGDHCSPISDTTILSSLASSCNHIDHVRTQLPYALTVGGVAIVVGIVPAAFGVPSWLLFILSLGLLYGIVQWFGKEVPDANQEA